MLSPKAAAFGVEALLRVSSNQEAFKDANVDDQLIVKEEIELQPRCSGDSYDAKDYDNRFSGLNNLKRTQEHSNYEKKSTLTEQKISLKRHLELNEAAGKDSTRWMPNPKKLRRVECSEKDLKSVQNGHIRTVKNNIVYNFSSKKNFLQNDNNYKIYPCIDSILIKENITKWPIRPVIEEASNSATFTTNYTTEIHSLNNDEKQSPQRTLGRTTTNEQCNEQQRPADKRGINVSLQHRSLWNQFHQHETEMIVTKNGRRMFPVIKIKIQGLKPDTLYMIYLDIMPMDGRRYRYAYLSSTWVVAGTGDSSPHDRAVYIHPESPTTGRRWMDMLSISFDKLKLTNNRTWNAKGQIYLQSMQKYLPRIWIQSLENNFDNEQPASQDPNFQQKLIDRNRSVCFTFPETTFITVTAYQNQKITRLKINTNPFAKGFRDNSKYKTTTAESQLAAPMPCGLICQRRPHYPINILPSISTPFLPPPLPYTQPLSYPPSYYTRPSFYSNRWSLYPSLNPSNEVFSSINSFFNRSTYECKGNEDLIDLTKKKEKT